jgi:hypothetical protein
METKKLVMIVQPIHKMCPLSIWSFFQPDLCPTHPWSDPSFVRPILFPTHPLSNPSFVRPILRPTFNLEGMRVALFTVAKTLRYCYCWIKMKTKKLILIATLFWFHSQFDGHPELVDVGNYNLVIVLILK